MKVDLSINNAKLNLQLGDVIIGRNIRTLEYKTFLVVSNIDNSFPYSLLNIQQNKIKDNYKTISALIDSLKMEYEIMEIVPSEQLELRRIYG